MRIRDGIFPLVKAIIDPNLNSFAHGGWEPEYLGIECMPVTDHHATTPLPEWIDMPMDESLYILFRGPNAARPSVYLMKRSEIMPVSCE